MDGLVAQSLCASQVDFCEWFTSLPAKASEVCRLNSTAQNELAICCRVFMASLVRELYPYTHDSADCVELSTVECRSMETS
jgi:hypothetical protein